MGNLFRKLRQLICRHEWQITKFQALVPGTSYECTRCGKPTRTYFGAPPVSRKGQR